MDHFLYRDGRLHAEDVAIQEIAAQVGTPFYVYSTATLIRHFKLFDEALDGLDHLKPMGFWPERIFPLQLGKASPPFPILSIDEPHSPRAEISIVACS